VTRLQCRVSCRLTSPTQERRSYRTELLKLFLAKTFRSNPTFRITAQETARQRFKGQPSYSQHVTGQKQKLLFIISLNNYLFLEHPYAVTTQVLYKPGIILRKRTELEACYDEQIFHDNRCLKRDVGN